MVSKVFSTPFIWNHIEIKSIFLLTKTHFKKLLTFFFHLLYKIIEIRIKRQGQALKSFTANLPSLRLEYLR